MSKPGHDIVVKVGLTADQYLHLVRMADDVDMTQSAYMRRLLIDRITACAHDAAQASDDASTIPVQHRA